MCGADGHTYKKCPKMQEDNAGVEVGPSGNPTDGLPPDFGARRVQISLYVHMYLNQMYGYVF